MLCIGELREQEGICESAEMDDMLGFEVERGEELSELDDFVLK